ncbi:MAG TPA: FtsX-like permease family protein [Vicinamibacterales bacterium]|nr:FtsX-like permease family protein [Vicinamibacterales bacterium]
MNAITQLIAVTMLNLRTIPQRLGSSGVAIIGIAGVVIVLVSVLSIAQGFAAAMEGTGSPVRALIMRSGADSEMTSGLGATEVDLIKQAPGLQRDGRTAVASAELYVIIDIPKIGTNSPANVPMRGVEPTATAVRGEFSIGEGRMFEFGTNEVVVGRGAAVNFQGLHVGNTIQSGQNTWKIVGLFETNGSVAETEIWCDARVLQGAYRRGNTFQSLLARLDSSQSFNMFRDWLTANPQLNVQVRRETEYYAQQSRALTSLIRGVGFGIAALMGIGAVFGAILTMYTAVSTRSREIATLRALGFNTTSVVVSVLAESLALAAIGGAIGGVLAYLAFNGYQTSTMNFSTFSQVAFAFQVTPQLLAMGLFYALIMGLVGGLFPALRAARLPIPSALREL